MRTQLDRVQSSPIFLYISFVASAPKQVCLYERPVDQVSHMPKFPAWYGARKHLIWCYSVTLGSSEDGSTQDTIPPFVVLRPRPRLRSWMKLMINSAQQGTHSEKPPQCWAGNHLFLRFTNLSHWVQENLTSSIGFSEPLCRGIWIAATRRSRKGRKQPLKFTLVQS